MGSATSDLWIYEVHFLSAITPLWARSLSWTTVQLSVRWPPGLLDSLRRRLAVPVDHRDGAPGRVDGDSDAELLPERLALAGLAVALGEVGVADGGLVDSCPVPECDAVLVAVDCGERAVAKPSSCPRSSWGQRPRMPSHVRHDIQRESGVSLRSEDRASCYGASFK